MREPYDHYWELAARVVEPSHFFGVLAEHFPEATAMYFEGTSFSPTVLSSLHRHEEAGEIVPDSNTIWPRFTQIRCAYTPDLLRDLARLAEVHAIPELCDHLFVYRDRDFILYCHDAFDGEMFADPSLPADRIKKFATVLGCEVRSVDHRRKKEPSPK